jgi:hypothetical protein
MIQAVQLKLASNVDQIASLAKEAKTALAQYDKKVMEYKILAESHENMFSAEILNVKHFADNDLNVFGSETACSLLRTQMENSTERNLESAVKSLEQALAQGEDSVLKHIELSAESIEQLIPELQRQIEDKKADMAESHDISSLLQDTVVKNYETMRDGYITLIRKVYEEESAQWKSLLKLQQPTDAWHLHKLAGLCESQKVNPTVNKKREQIFQESTRQLEAYCEHSFEQIKKSKMYEEKTEHLQKIEVLKRAVFKYKSGIVLRSESHLHRAEIGLDAFYMNSLEDINEAMYALQDSLQKVTVYEKKLEYLLVLAFQRELRMDRLQRKLQRSRAGSSRAGSSRGGSPQARRSPSPPGVSGHDLGVSRSRSHSQGRSRSNSRSRSPEHSRNALSPGLFDGEGRDGGAGGVLHQQHLYGDELRATSPLVRARSYSNSYNNSRAYTPDSTGMGGGDLGPGSAAEEKAEAEALSAALIRLGQQTLRDKTRTPFAMGTMLHSYARACDLSPEATEKLMDYVLFGY